MSGGHIVVIKRTGLDGSRFPLLSGSVTVGKGQDCDIRVLLNTVSDEQCIITVNKNQSVIKNLSSSYLTVVNGEPIQVRALEDGDVITVGDRSLRWEYLVKPPAQKAQMLKTTEKVKVNRKKLGSNVAQGRRSEGPAKRVDAQIKKMLDIKSRNSIANLPSIINTRQIAVVKPQRRSLDLTNKEQADNGIGESLGTPSRRRKETAVGLSAQSKRTPINNKNEKKIDFKPKLVTKPHRGKSMSPTQENIIKTRYSGKRDTASIKSTPNNMSTRGSGKKNRSKTILNNSVPKARTTPAKVIDKKSVPVTKIQAPVTMDENKKAALMILTGRSPIKKNFVTPSKKTVKVELSVKESLSKLETGRNTPKYIVPKKSPAKNIVSASKPGSRFTHKSNGSGKKSVAVNQVAKSISTPRASSRGAGTPKMSSKKNTSSETSLNGSIKVSTTKISPTITFRSVLKSPVSKSVRKSETIKFDLSNLDLDNKSVQSPLKRKFSKSDSESPDSKNIRLCYSDISKSSSKSPSPRHSGRERQQSAISRTNVSLRSFNNTYNVSSGSLENVLSNSSAQSRSRKLNASVISILDNSIDSPIKDRSSRSNVQRRKDSHQFADSPIVLYSKSNSFSNVSQNSVTENMSRRSRSMNDIGSMRKTTRSIEKNKKDPRTKSPYKGKESLQNRSSLRRSTKNSPPSSMIKQSPMKFISSNAKASESLPKPQKNSSISLRRHTYSVEENGRARASNSSLYGLRLPKGNGDDAIISPSTPEDSGSMSNEVSTPVLSLQHLLNTSNGNSSFSRVQDTIKHFESIGLSKTPEPTKRLTRRTLGAIGERIQIRMSEIAAKPEGKSSTDPRKNTKLTRITKSNISRSLSNINKASIKKIVGRPQISIGNKDDGSVASDVTDENAAKPDNSLIITPKSTVKLLPEVVKEKHSTARKPFSKKSIIDNLNESQDIVKQLFSSPVKRKLSQSMNQLSASQLSDEEPDFPPRNKMMRRSKGTPNISFDFDGLKTPKVPTEMFVSPLDKSRKSSTSNIIGVKKLFQKNSPENDLRHVGGIKKLMLSPPIQKSPLNDLTKVVNLKQFLQTPGKPRKSPKNDLTNVAGVKRLLRTPKGKQKSPKNDLTNVAGIKKLLSSPGKGQKSPKNDLTNVTGVKKLLKSPDGIQNSPVNDLTDVFGVKKMFAPPRGKQKSPTNDLTNVQGVKQILASPKVRKSPRNDLINISSIKSLFGKDDTLIMNKSKSSNVNKSGKVSIVEDISGVEELLNTSRSTTKDHEVSLRSETLFDQLVGRPQIRSYSRGRSLGRAKQVDTKHMENRSLPLSYNIGAWLKEVEMQNPVSKKEEAHVNKLNQNYKVPKELNNLTIDMVENNVVFDPNQRSTRRTAGKSDINISLPLKKRVHSNDGTSGISITDNNDKRSHYDVNIVGLDTSTKSGKRSSKSHIENSVSLPLKKRVLLKKQDTSTPVKAKKPQDLNTIDLGPVSPISKLSLTHEVTELPEIIHPVTAVITKGRRLNRQNLQNTSPNESTTEHSLKSKKSTKKKKQDNATSESHAIIEGSSTRRGRSKKVIDNSEEPQKHTSLRAKKSITVDPLSEELNQSNNKIVSPKKLRRRRGIQSVEKSPPESPKAIKIVKGKKSVQEIKTVEANNISSVNIKQNNSSQIEAVNVSTNRRKRRGKQSKDEDPIIIQVSPPKRSARRKKGVDNSPPETMKSVDTSFVNLKSKRGRGMIYKGVLEEGIPKTSTKAQETNENAIDGPPAGSTKIGRGRRKKESEIRDETQAQIDNASKGRRGRKVVKLPIDTNLQQNVCDNEEAVRTKPTTRGRRKATVKEQKPMVSEQVAKQSKNENTLSTSKNEFVPELPVRSTRQRKKVV